MSGLETLGKQVARRVRDLAKNYIDLGAVRVRFIDEEFADVQISGTRRYNVDLERDGKDLVCSCDCPRFNSDLEICKHIWAALLALEKSGDIKKWEKGFPSRLVPLFFPEDPGADAADGGCDLPGRDVHGEARPPAPSAPHGAPSDSWRRVLDRLRSAHTSEKRQTPWPEDRELLYVMDRSRRFTEKNMVIRIDVRDRKKNGDWRKPKPLSISTDALPELPDPTDQEIMDRLIGAKRDTWYFTPAHDTQLRFHLERRALEALLPAIARTGRLYVGDEAAGELHPVAWDGEGRWEFCIDVVPSPRAAGARDRGRYMVRGAFHRGGERIDAAQPEFVCAEGFLVCDGKVAPFSGAFAWVDFFRVEEAFSVPEAEADEWLESMLRLPDAPPLRLPEQLRIADVRVAPRAVVRIDSGKAHWGGAYLAASLHFDYGGNQVAAGDGTPCLADVAARRRILRDFAAEERARRKFEDAGFKPRADFRGAPVWTLPQARLAATVRELVAEGWHVEAEGKVFHAPGAFTMRIASGIDWFELHGDVEFDGARVKLPRLLAALRRREGTVRLEDGSYGVIPEEWLERYGVLAGLGKAEGDHVCFKRHQAGFLDALLAARPEVGCDELFERVRAQLRDFSGVEGVDAPAGFQGELRAYQRDGLGWMHFLRKFGLGGCLADDMGLGKTIQVLALLEARRAARAAAPDEVPPSLVVLPRSLVFNWRSEAARFTPGLRVLEHTGTERIRGHEHFDGYDAVFTTYGTLRRDAAFFKDREFDYIVLDESQAIKNASTESAKAVRLLRGRHRLALSGTPIENHLGELWSLFEFLNPGMLGAASAFNPGRGGLGDERREFLARALRPFILRRTKAQVARDLPEKVELTLYCTLEPAQRALYDELRDHYRQALLGRIQGAGLAKSKMHVLEALLRLRQAAIHPGLIDPRRAGEPSAKMDLLLPQVREVAEAGHKALVFSQFTSMLALVRQRLDEEGVRYEYLDGRTRNRAAAVERFQSDPETKLFLISLKAGGLGLNLTAAEYVFLLDPWWNPAVEAQAVDRTHRIGQTRSVFAYRLIAKDTVEEKVLELQSSKRHIADAIIGQDNSVLGSLKAEDLEMLLG
ncbi:MAG: DEAD/DEAH box helicase [Acidobacteriota bacterium]|jgi:superfamily II DNA or RNA helicase|nr:DEAD/DEAH box helicase [Acidobacteriota bacterium]